MTGQIDAATEKDAKIMLVGQGLIPVSLETTATEVRLPLFWRKSRKAQTKELIALTRQFAALFKAGVSMDRILYSLIKQTQNIDLKNTMMQIQEDVSHGASLMTAFAKHPKYFNDLYVNMINVGEQGGVLDHTLRTLVDILKKEYRIINSIKSATLYPKIVLITFLVVVTLLMMFVMPGFADFYAGFDAKLPLPTIIMMTISDFFVDYWYVLLAIAITLYLAYKKYSATEKGSFQIDGLKFRLPVFGHLNLMVVNARFGHLIASLYSSGLTLGRALTIVGNTIGNKVYKKDIDMVRESMNQGASLSDAMKNSKRFTSLMIESVSTGEQSGSLDEVLNTTAEFYDEEVTDILDQLTTLIEPILLFGLFGMIALLAFAVFLPIWKTTQLILPPLQ